MSISKLKFNASAIVYKEQKKLYITALIYILLQIVLSVISVIFDNGEDINASFFIDMIAPFLIFPVFFANIAMISNLRKKESVEYGAFHYYTGSQRFFRSILSSLVPSLMLMLWTIPFIVAAVAIGIMASFENLLSLSIILGIVIGIFGLVFLIIKSLQYSFTPYIMAQDEKIGSFEALQESKKLLKGNLGGFFLLNLSFVGWFFLSILTLGLLLIWLLPYYNATLIEYLNELQNNKNNTLDENNEDDSTN